MITEADMQRLAEIQAKVNDEVYELDTADVAWLITRLKEFNEALLRQYRLNAVLRGCLKEVL